MLLPGVCCDVVLSGWLALYVAGKCTSRSAYAPRLPTDGSCGGYPENAASMRMNCHYFDMTVCNVSLRLL